MFPTRRSREYAGHESNRREASSGPVRTREAIRCRRVTESVAQPRPRGYHTDLCHKIRQAILSGEIQDQAEAARRLGLTRARLSQILDLTNVAPELQEEILFLEAVDGHEPLRERALRGALRFIAWADHRKVLAHRKT